MNWDIVGQDWAVQMLQKHLEHKNVRHAYLFTGPQGVGKRTLALRFAQALNCSTPRSPAEPCGECRTCRQIYSMKHADLMLVSSGEEGDSLKVDQVRQLGQVLSLSPYEAHYRLALLLNFHQATISAQNALLKNLEEAPQRVILLLTADTPEDLLPTIVSRCEVLRLRPMPVSQLQEALVNRWKVLPEQAQLVAALSGGRLGYALKLIEDPQLLEERHSWIDDLLRLLQAPLTERFAYAEPVSKKKEKVQDALQVWLSFWRDILYCAAGNPIDPVNLDWQDEIQQLADQVGFKIALERSRHLEKALSQLDANVNTRLMLEVLLMDMPQI